MAARRRFWALTNYFGQFLSLQWNTGEFGADSAETSTQDPLGLFAVGGRGIEKGDDAIGNPNELQKRKKRAI